MLDARWNVLAGALLTAAVSIAASAVAAGRGGIDSTLLFGWASWIGLAELLALGLLAGWAAGALPSWRLVVALAVIVAAVLAIAEWRQSGRSNLFLNTALLIGLAGCVGAGLLLRQSDRDRRVAASRADSTSAWRSPASCTMSSPITSAGWSCKHRPASWSPTPTRIGRRKSGCHRAGRLRGPDGDATGGRGAAQ